MKIIKGNEKKLSLAAILKGVFVCIMSGLALTAIAAYMVSNAIVDENALGYIGIGVLGISAYIGSCFIKLSRTHSIFAEHMLCATGYFLVLLFTTILLFGGQFQGVWVSAALVYGCSLTACFIGKNHVSSRRVKHKKYKI